MTVGETIDKICKIHETIDALERIARVHNMMNGDAITIDDAIQELGNYVLELRDKHVK